ncbi:MAG: hypothetical protein ACK43N_08995, partial [Pirellulaceae bacterium]
MASDPMAVASIFAEDTPVASAEILSSEIPSADFIAAGSPADFTSAATEGTGAVLAEDPPRLEDPELAESAGLGLGADGLGAVGCGVHP